MTPKPWLNDGFSEDLWERDLTTLSREHRLLAREVFRYAVEVLHSEPFQRESSRTKRSDGQTIFRTKLHRSFWLVIGTKSGSLIMDFPDKEDLIGSSGVFTVKRTPGTQWTRKKEKSLIVPRSFTPADVIECMALIDRIHDAAVQYYGRGKDFSHTLRILIGEPLGGTPLAAPSEAEFERLLSESPRCETCGRNERLSLFRGAEGWRLFCDDHHPHRSPMREMGRDAIPFEVKRLVWHRDGGRCVTCGSEHYATFDHMIPANRGGGAFSGSHLETNIRLKCRSCNYSKGNKLKP